MKNIFHTAARGSQQACDLLIVCVNVFRKFVVVFFRVFFPNWKMLAHLRQLKGLVRLNEFGFCL